MVYSPAMKSFREIPREPRIPYSGRVRLLLDFAPWKLAFSLDGLNLSASGVLAHLAKAKEKNAEAEALLAVGDPYQLQIEHDGEHLPVPVVTARLVRRQAEASGLALGFAFEAPGGELLGLIHELGSRVQAPSSRL